MEIALEVVIGSSTEGSIGCGIRGSQRYYCR